MVIFIRYFSRNISAFIYSWDILNILKIYLKIMNRIFINIFERKINCLYNRNIMINLIILLIAGTFVIFYIQLKRRIEEDIIFFIYIYFFRFLYIFSNYIE